VAGSMTVHAAVTGWYLNAADPQDISGREIMRTYVRMDVGRSAAGPKPARITRGRCDQIPIRRPSKKEFLAFASISVPFDAA
jgi:hypothetical protein